jgi:hypothetical protein
MKTITSIGALLTPTFVALAFAACDFSQVSPPPSNGLELFAFPSQVPPGGEATIALSVSGNCGDAGTCTVCVLLAPDSPTPGDLFAPAFPAAGAGTGGSTASSSSTSSSSTSTSSGSATTTLPTTTELAFPGFAGPYPLQMIYRAPAEPGQQVISAATFVPGTGDAGTCSGSLVAETTTLVVIEAPSSTADAGAAADSGGSSGSVTVTVTVTNGSAVDAGDGG